MPAGLHDRSLKTSEEEARERIENREPSPGGDDLQAATTRKTLGVSKVMAEVQAVIRKME